jgi:hypothetical protein
VTTIQSWLPQRASPPFGSRQTVFDVIWLRIPTNLTKPGSRSNSANSMPCIPISGIKKLRAELSHCQRWVEIRIGEWLGPAKPPEETGGMRSSPGNDLERVINDRHKHEFRFLAENKGILRAILEDHKGVKITRAALLRLAAWQEALAKSLKHQQAPALLGDFRQIELQPESIDWVITDPPYAKEYLPLYSDLSRCTERWLRPGGSLLIMSGQSYSREVLNALASHLTCHWMLAYLTPGGQSAQLWDRKVNTFWKPVLWCVKGDYEGPWIGDVCKSAVNDNDKNHHH